jgi:hypothetical protein
MVLHRPIELAELIGHKGELTSCAGCNSGWSDQNRLRKFEEGVAERVDKRNGRY